MQRYRFYLEYKNFGKEKDNYSKIFIFVELYYIWTYKKITAQKNEQYFYHSL